MTRKLAAALTLALLLAAPLRADAYYLSCGNSVDLILSGNEALAGVAVGHAAGAVDVLAGLICLTGGSTCSCLSNVVSVQTERYADALANELISCGTSDPAFGAALRAARQVCG